MLLDRLKWEHIQQALRARQSSAAVTASVESA